MCVVAIVDAVLPSSRRWSSFVVDVVSSFVVAAVIVFGVPSSVSLSMSSLSSLRSRVGA